MNDWTKTLLCSMDRPDLGWSSVMKQAIESTTKDSTMSEHSTVPNVVVTMVIKASQRNEMVVPN